MRMRYRRKKRIAKFDSALNNALLIVLTLASLLGAVMFSDYLGYVSYTRDRAGTINQVNINKEDPAVYWNGLYGIVVGGFQLNNSWFVTATNAGMNNMNLIVPCMEGGIDHEVYASAVRSEDIDWQSVTAATPQSVDDWLGINYTDKMSATSTFTETITVEVGNMTITNVPATHTKQYSDPFSTVFKHGLLTDGTNFIFVSIITDQYLAGYNPNTGPINYQMFVPVRINTSQMYYMYTDPFDYCPQGAANAQDEGSVVGIVSDNKTGVLLENAFVYLGHEYVITPPTGYFNLSALAGDYMIVALKPGYINYVGNVSVIRSQSVEYNITMEPYQPPQPGTGTGFGTGTGVGPGRNNNVGPGQDIGPGMGPGIGPYLKKPIPPGVDHFLSLDALVKKIRIGNFFVDNLLIFSFREQPVRLKLNITGNASKIVKLDKTDFTIEQNKYENITITGFGRDLGVYTGELKLSGDFNDSIPVMITVTDEDKLPIEALLMELEVLTTRPYAGNKFKYKINLHNMLVEENYNVSLYYTIKGVELATSNYSMNAGNDTVDLLTSLSLIKEVTIPKNWPKGDYYLSVDAYYLDLNSQASTLFTVFEPIYMYSLFGVMPLWKLLLLLTGLALLIIAIIIARRRLEARKRFHAKVEYNLLPKKGPRSLYVGKIAETERDTYFDMDKLTVHTIVAGSTGGGKTISAQVIVEECLLKGVGIVVFDPTAQWTGMLRKCTDEKMLSFYPRFNMTKKDARAFNGNIRAIKNAREKIDIMKYWKPGELQVFTTSTLDPKDMDIFVANTVREVFHSNLQEFRGLRLLMVYDEVHRLLPKFGGSGEGFIQIERACREFRKWGIGVMLVSQVLADFVGQIKANINTEVQMKTRDEGDLKRIETKYGSSYIQELVKAPVGSGMVQNSDNNRGKPYYITFRPIMHSVVRLADPELEQYNKFNDLVDDLDSQLEQLEKENIDIFDLKLELKLARDKIKSGNFNMVDIYLEGLKPRIEKHWKDLGKSPAKRKVELISENEINAELSAAKKAREDYEKEHPEEKKEEKKDGPIGFSDSVPPDKLLKLVNGMLVISMKSLYDEISAMKPSEFRQHVNEDKNDFSDWIRDAVKNAELAAIAEQIITKEDFLKFLDLAEKGKAKDFKPETKREKPIQKPTDKTEPPKKEEPKKPDQGPKPDAESESKADKPSQAAQQKAPDQPVAPSPTKSDSPPKQDEQKPEKKENERFLKNAEPGKYFMMADGSSIKSLKELHEKLSAIGDEYYGRYVGENKNDFANWIFYVLREEALAEEMRKAKSRSEAIKALEVFRDR